MCNRYRNYVRKAGLEFETWGYEEFSETRIKIRLGERLDVVKDELFPDSSALVARLDDKGVLTPDVMRWGFPPLKPGMPVITNVRGTTKVRKDGVEIINPFWGTFLEADHRCLVPFTAFSEYDDRTPMGAKVLRWFEPTDGNTAAFAGIWRRWTGDRGTKSKPISGEHLIFSFLTCPPNAVVEPVHGKAMPVVLPRSDWDQWLTGSVEEALALQRPADDAFLRLAA